MHLNQATFLLSCAQLDQLPPDQGVEIAFAGRSNVGKSSTLNALTRKNKLAFASKTPGRTQLINLFALDDDHRLVDLPGYGYAEVSKTIKKRWQRTLADYLQQRECLAGLVLIVDIRHELKTSDREMVVWAMDCELPTHILLNKADKLSRNQQNQAFARFKESLSDLCTENLSMQLFSAKSKVGFDEACNKIDVWLGK